MKFLSFFKKAEDPEPTIQALEPSEIAEGLSKAQAEFDRSTAEHAAELAAKDEKIDELNAKIEELETSLTAKDQEIEDERASVSAKVQAQLAALSIEPVDAPSGDEPSLAEQYQAMEPGDERRAFRQKHMTALQKAGVIQNLTR